MARADVIPGPGSAGFRRNRVARLRYTAAAQAFHWLTALLFLAIVPIAWHMTMLARDDPTRETWFTLHKSLGLTILALSVLRLVWRASHPAPPLPPSMARAEAFLARASHGALYVMIFAMPVSGYLLSAAGGHPVSYFGLFEVPTLVPQNPQLAHAGLVIHNLGQWAVYALVVLHVAATAFHLVVRRDGVLDRMLPDQNRA